MIERIRADGREPEIEILRDGLDDGTAQMYEGVAIDVIGIDKLYNKSDSWTRDKEMEKKNR
jgi:hypothetical protein